MAKKLKRSTVKLIGAVLFGLCALAWLPDWPAEQVSWLRIAMPVLCAAAIFFLMQYFKNRKTEK